jgi:hypothetical protein
MKARNERWVSHTQEPANRRADPDDGVARPPDPEAMLEVDRVVTMANADNLHSSRQTGGDTGKVIVVVGYIETRRLSFQIIHHNPPTVGPGNIVRHAEVVDHEVVSQRKALEAVEQS